MKTPILPKSVIIKEIIRYEEEVFILNAHIEIFHQWEYRYQHVYLRADVNAISEILRLENPSQTIMIEEELLGMLSWGEPPRIDIKKLTGVPLELSASEMIIFMDPSTAQKQDMNVQDLPYVKEVLPKIQTEKLADYLPALKNDFSWEALDNTFTDFQRMFFLIEHGYDPETASEMTNTNSPAAVMIYNKLKAQIDPEPQPAMNDSAEEDFFREEAYIFKEVSTNGELPF